MWVSPTTMDGLGGEVDDPILLSLRTPGVVVADFEWFEQVLLMPLLLFCRRDAINVESLNVIVPG